MKQRVAEALAQRVQDGEVIGFGSGSTAELTIKAIGERIRKDGIRVSGVPTSIRTAMLAAQAGVQVIHPAVDIDIAWAFDGADEVDPRLRLIKGRGAAMLSEKIVAKRAKHFVVLITDEKLVDRLGSVFAVPIEVIRDGLSLVTDGLKALGAEAVELRQAEGKYGPIITEHNNCVLDARFAEVSTDLEGQINQITGVVENGLFTDFNPEVLIARADGVWSRTLVDGKTQDRQLV